MSKIKTKNKNKNKKKAAEEQNARKVTEQAGAELCQAQNSLSWLSVG